MGLKKILIERVIHDDIREARQYLIDNGIELEDTDLEYYIGSGAYGDVYKVRNKNKVIKFIDDPSGEEVKKYEALEKANNLQNVCNVHFIKRVSPSSNIFIIVLDFLEEHNMFNSRTELREMSAFISHMEPEYRQMMETPDEYDMKTNVKKFVRKYMEIDSMNISDDARELLEGLGGNYGDNKELMSILLVIFNEFILPFEMGNTMITEMLIKNLNKEPQFFKDIFNGIKEYQEMGISHGDVHLFNILKDERKNNFKLIDPI